MQSLRQLSYIKLVTRLAALVSGDFQDVPLDDTPPKPAAKPLPLKKGGAAVLAALREENADLKQRLAAVEAVRPVARST